VLRRIFGLRRDEVIGEWRKVHNKELHDLYSSPSIIRIMKSRRMRWAGHVARMGEKRNAHRLLVGKPEGKRPLGRPRLTHLRAVNAAVNVLSSYSLHWLVTTKLDDFLSKMDHSISIGNMRKSKQMRAIIPATADTHFTLLHMSLKFELFSNGRRAEFIKSSISSSTETESIPD
jgi:hypothetical protein